LQNREETSRTATTFDVCVNCNAESYNFAKNKSSNDKRCNAEGRK